MRKPVSNILKFLCDQVRSILMTDGIIYVHGIFHDDDNNAC